MAVDGDAAAEIYREEITDRHGLYRAVGRLEANVETMNRGLDEMRGEIKTLSSGLDALARWKAAMEDEDISQRANDERKRRRVAAWALGIGGPLAGFFSRWYPGHHAK